MAEQPTVFYIALLSGAASPYALLSSHCTERSAAHYESSLKEIWGTRGYLAITGSQKSRLEVTIDNRGTPQNFIIELDYSAEGRVEWVYVCVASKATPTRLLFSASSASGGATLLSELRQMCHRILDSDGSQDAKAEARALQKGLKSELKPLVENFNKAGGGDKLKALQVKVREVQGTMLATLNKATEKDGLLEEIQVKTKKLEKTAEGFYADAGTLKSRACCKLYSIYLMVAIAAAVIIGIVLLVTKYQYHYW